MRFSTSLPSGLAKYALSALNRSSSSVVICCAVGATFDEIVAPAATADPSEASSYCAIKASRSGSDITIGAFSLTTANEPASYQ